MSRVVLFGTGAVARVAHFFLTHDSPHEVVAFAVDRDHWLGGEMEGLPIVAFEDLPALYPPGDFAMFIAVGYRRMNRFRAERYERARAMGYELITYVSSKATIWPEAAIGRNCLIMENNVVQPFAEIGNDVIMWGGSYVGHGSVIRDHCFVASHVVVSGFVTIEPNCFLGVNSTIRDEITIARECVIGAGALIMKSTKEREVYVGPTAQLLSFSSDRLPNL